MGAPAKLTDGQISYFLGTMCPEADMAFRFAYSLYLGNGEAFDATRAAYRDAIGNIAQFQRNGDDMFALRQYLIQQVWNQFNAKSVSTSPTAPVTQKLGRIEAETRAIMVAIDVCGLKPREAVQIFGVDEESLRVKLAQARQQLIEQN